MDSTTNATVQKIVKIFKVISDDLGLVDAEIDIVHMHRFVHETISAIVDLVDNGSIPHEMGVEAVFLLTKITRLESADEIKEEMEKFNIAYPMQMLKMQMLNWGGMKRMLQPTLRLAVILGAMEGVKVYIDLLRDIEGIPEDFQMPSYEQIFTRVVD